MGPSEAVLLGLLLGALGAAECGSHSLRYFLTGMTDPGPGMPRFVIVGYVDGDLFGKYDSKSRSAQPIVEMLPQEDQEHWAAQTQKAWGGERDFDRGLRRLPERYNRSGGSHTLQKMFGCDILEDGSIRGYDQYAFDGRDFLAFDMDTMTFTAADPVAEITKRRWEEEGTYAERWKHELGTVCVQNLRRYLEHGKAALKRRARSTTSFICRAAQGASVGEGGRRDPDLVLPRSRLLPAAHRHQLDEGRHGPGPGDPLGGHRAQQRWHLLCLSCHQCAAGGWGQVPVPCGARQPAPAQPLFVGTAAQPDPHCGRGGRCHCGCHRCCHWIGGVEEQVRVGEEGL